MFNLNNQTLFSTYFQSMSLAKRLSWGFISVLVLLLAVAITSSIALELQGLKVQWIVEVNNLKTALANDLMGSINDACYSGPLGDVVH